jgi:hypothetical protein
MYPKPKEVLDTFLGEFHLRHPGHVLVKPVVLLREARKGIRLKHYSCYSESERHLAEKRGGLFEVIRTPGGAQRPDVGGLRAQRRGTQPYFRIR